MLMKDKDRSLLQSARAQFNHKMAVWTNQWSGAPPPSDGDQSFDSFQAFDRSVISDQWVVSKSLVTLVPADSSYNTFKAEACGLIWP